MMMYNRVSLEHPEMMEMIPKDIIHMYYSYSAKNVFPGIELACDKGFTMGVHPGMNNWQRFFSFWNGKQTAPYFKTIYSILEQWPYEWRRGRTIMPYFRHPFLPNVGGYYPDAKEIQRIKNRTKLALDLIDEVNQVIEFRSTDLDYLEFCARTHLNMIEMEVLASNIRSIDTNSLNDENMNQVVMFTNKRIRNVI